jgi:hypothetical protein
MKLIDDLFYVTQENWGNWISIDKDGKKIVTAYTEQNCIDATHYFLQMIQENSNGTL